MKILQPKNVQKSLTVTLRAGTQIKFRQTLKSRWEVTVDGKLKYLMRWVDGADGARWRLFHGGHARFYRMYTVPGSTDWWVLQEQVIILVRKNFLRRICTGAAKAAQRRAGKI